MRQKLDFSEFSLTDATDWQEKVKTELSKTSRKPFEFESLEGIRVKPFYTQEDIKDIPRFEVPSRKWKILLNVGQYPKKGEWVGEMLKNDSVDALWLDEGENRPQGSIGIEDLQQYNLPIQFKKNALSKADTLSHLAVNAGSGFILDPLGYLARNGSWSIGRNADLGSLTEVVTNAALTTSIGIEMGLYQNAGANCVQQLAIGVAQAYKYLEFLIKNGHGNFGQLRFVFNTSIGYNYFFEIAKLRALRWLWQSVLNRYGVEMDFTINATPSFRNKTITDPNVNLLRTQSEYMAAVIGGADCIIPQAYDALYNEPNFFGERIARNQLLLLKEEAQMGESNIATVQNCYYLQWLTHEMAERAMKVFKSWEAKGGFVELFENGVIQELVNESDRKEKQWYKDGKINLVGTSVFADPNEQVVEMKEGSFLDGDKLGVSEFERIVPSRLAINDEAKIGIENT